jgi:methylenetetrahydrofolate dehydrogenase (NADP+) / methenyltetrahydrofolate cyclohydrolase
MNIIEGKKIAEDILNRLRGAAVPKKFFAVVLAGDNSASVSFIEQKKKTAEALGVDFRWYRFPDTISQDELREEVGKIAGQKTCGSVLVQLPLPEHINRHYVLNAMPREKDVDVLGERALGAFYAHRNPVLPPVVGTVKEILDAAKFDLKGKVVSVVGLGLLIGKPIANWLMGQTKGLYLLGKGSDFSVLAKSDLVIVGVGKAGLVTPDMLKDGAGVIDFGYSTGEDGKLAGDFLSGAGATGASPADLAKLSFYTPTPGGTGPVLVAKLFENFYTLAGSEK